MNRIGSRIRSLLRLILTHLVNVFDAPPVMDFWSKICHYRSGSGGDHIGGWISAHASTLPKRPMWGPSEQTALPSTQEILSAKKEIKALEIELQDAIEALEKAQHHVEILTKRLEEGKAWIAPIRRLPVELLSEIFVINSKDEPLGPVKVASVCRRWRGIVLATPHAWCDIWLENNLSVNNCYQYVSTFLKRSDPVLLHIGIPEEYDFNNDDEPSVCSLVFKNSHRMRCLSIYGQQLSDLQGVTFPNLRELMLFELSGTLCPSDLGVSSFPLLNFLHALHNLWRTLTWSISSQQIPPLKRLSILVDTERAWIDIVRCCSKTLESLNISSLDEDYEDPPNFMIDFSALKFLAFNTVSYNSMWPTQAITPVLVSYQEMHLSDSENCQLHRDVGLVTHLRTTRVPFLAPYYSLRVLGLLSPPTLALLLFKRLEENINVCPLLETIELILRLRGPSNGDDFHSAKGQIEEENRKTNRAIQLIFSEEWTIEMAFDLSVTMCDDKEPCSPWYPEKKLLITK